MHCCLALDSGRQGLAVVSHNRRSEEVGGYIYIYIYLYITKFSKLRYANTLIPPLGPKEEGLPSSTEQPLTFRCNRDDCTFEADTSQKLAVHMFKVHQVKSIWKNYLGDHVHCPICLKHFHTRERVLNHVRYRSRFVGTIWC